MKAPILFGGHYKLAGPQEQVEQVRTYLAENSPVPIEFCVLDTEEDSYQLVSVITTQPDVDRFNGELAGKNRLNEILCSIKLPEAMLEGTEEIKRLARQLFQKTDIVSFDDMAFHVDEALDEEKLRRSPEAQRLAERWEAYSDRYLEHTESINVTPSLIEDLKAGNTRINEDGVLIAQA